MAHLTFSRPPASDAHLTFGGSEDVAGDAVIDGVLTLVRPTVAGGVALGLLLGGTVALARPSLSGGLEYRSNTSRPVVGTVAGRFQDADDLPAAVASRLQDGQRRQAVTSSRWADTLPLQADVASWWSDAPRVAAWTVGRLQDALPVGADARTRWQDNLRRDLLRGTRLQDAVALGTSARSRVDDALQAFVLACQRLQDARLLLAGVATWISPALPLGGRWGVRYQDAIPPLPGIWIKPGPEPKEPCYLPDAHLTFEAMWDDSGHLIFVCERHDGPGPEPDATVVVPVRRVYLVQNSLILTRVPGGDEIPAKAFSMSLDADSWTWQWSATLPGGALSMIEPTGGVPVDVLASINGVGYRLCVESYSRQRRFASSEIRVSGRGRAAVLDAPYAPVLNHVGDSALTVQQLMAKVLTLNGVGIGWDVEFGLTDWLVPAGTWALQGSYIAGVQDIAGAAGAIVQPHRTDATLRILPRYPVAPWEWGDVTPDFELPSAAVVVEGIEWITRPQYNRVFVTGATSDGVIGQVTRSGTAGDIVAPMVTHSLITHVDGARQRGLPELANTGQQVMVSLRTQVLPETGIIVPGQFVRYVDGGDEYLGLVRSTSVDWQRPALRQSITLETHLEEA